MDSNILNYWDLEAGGALFMSEPIRRIFPRPRSEVEQYNPIMNSMPSWLPNRFKRGDPYEVLLWVSQGFLDQDMKLYTQN